MTETPAQIHDIFVYLLSSRPDQVVDMFLNYLSYQNVDALRAAIRAGFDVNTLVPGGPRTLYYGDGDVPVVLFAETYKNPAVLRVFWEAGARPVTPFLEELFADFAGGGDGVAVCKKRTPAEVFSWAVVEQNYDAVRAAIAAGFDVNTPIPGKVPIVQFAVPALDPVMLRILWEAGARPCSEFLEKLFADFASGGDGSAILNPPREPVGRLILHRFCGDEEYAVVLATMQPSKEGKKTRLCFKVQTQGNCLKSQPDTAEMKAHPNAEVSVIAAAKELAAKQLVGKSFSVPCGYDEKSEDHVALMYYADHADLDNNEIKILAKEGKAFRVQWTGTTVDVNHYDGSKPKTRVEIEALFSLLKLE